MDILFHSCTSLLQYYDKHIAFFYVFFWQNFDPLYLQWLCIFFNWPPIQPCVNKVTLQSLPYSRQIISSVKPTDSFSTETKQTYSNSIKILFTNINHKMTEVERKPLAYLYHLNLEANPSNNNAISKKHEYNIEKYRMHSTDSLGTCDCLDWFIHIFKHILQKRLWYGFLLDLKEKPSVAWNLWKIEKSIACLCDRKK